MFSEKETARQRARFFRGAMRGLVAGLLVFFLLVLVDRLSVWLGLTGAQRFADDLIGGLIVGVVSFLDDRRRNRYLSRRLQVIALMNHHVRNSLQAIKFAHYTDQEVRTIDDAIARIEWALREILPGDVRQEPSSAVMSNGKAGQRKLA